MKAKPGHNNIPINNIPQGEEPIKKMSFVDPINDFKKMLKASEPKIQNDAFRQLQLVTKRMIEDSFMGNYYKKAFNCMQEFRIGAIQMKQGEKFNSYLQEIKLKYSKGKHSEVWSEILRNKLTLITKGESDGVGITTE